MEEVDEEEKVEVMVTVEKLGVELKELVERLEEQVELEEKMVKNMQEVLGPLELVE